MYYDCRDCVWASNSPKQAEAHRAENPDHFIFEDEDDV